MSDQSRLKQLNVPLMEGNIILGAAQEIEEKYVMFAAPTKVLDAGPHASAVKDAYNKAVQTEEEMEETYGANFPERDQPMSMSEVAEKVMDASKDAAKSAYEGVAHAGEKTVEAVKEIPEKTKEATNATADAVKETTEKGSSAVMDVFHRAADAITAGANAFSQTLSGRSIEPEEESKEHDENASAASNKWHNQPNIASSSPSAVSKKNSTANEAASTAAGATMSF